jgi:hypothetical protein
VEFGRNLLSFIHKWLTVDYVRINFHQKSYFSHSCSGMNSDRTRSIPESFFMARETVGPRPPHFRFSESNSVRHVTVCRAPLDQCSAARRDLSPTKHNNHKTQTSCPRLDLNPPIPAGKRPHIRLFRSRGHRDLPNLGHY